METTINAEILFNAGLTASRPRHPLESADAQVVDVVKIEGTPYVVVPEGSCLKDLEPLLPTPVRKRGEIKVSQTISFVDYLKKHGSLAECTIYADIDAQTSKVLMVGIIDDHGADKPGWRGHLCRFTPALSVEWKRWMGQNGKPMGQSDFATWLEDNLGDIASVPGMPSGAQILEMALGFEANADKRVRSHVNLQNGGIRFEYVEDETKDTRTSMEVFKRFTLGLPVFDGSSDAYPVEARLKYREKEGKLTFWYELIRPDRAFKTAVQSSVDAIKAGTGFPIIYGTPT